MKVPRTIVAFLAFIAIVLSCSSFSALAQVQTAPSGPTPWITWRAATYIPSAFAGRALPSPGSDVVVAIDMIQNGVPMDLSKETIYWYVDDNYVTGGTGLARTSITMPDILSQEGVAVRVSLPQFAGGTAKTINIPIALAQAVMTVLPPDPAAADPNASFNLLAEPYFFTVNDPSELTIGWTVNGQAPSTHDDPTHLQIAVPAGTPSETALAVHLRIENTAHAFETAVQDLVLTVQ
jgi:hypothetical protein